ncbi:MAG TPA: post-transcriptional regulator [Virgibacillus sp.]|nr:post-transcriptional regulator [Virgibacillus sp.]
MDYERTVAEWKPYVTPALISKTDELLLMGYSNATIDDIWDCLVKNVWNGNPKKRLYEVVQDIFHLRSHTYMSYLTLNVLEDDDLAASIAAVTGAEDSSSEK